MKICSIDNCEREAKKRNWCSAHYQRWYKYGDPLSGSTFKGEALNFFEQSLLTESEDCIIWPYFKNSSGYGEMNVNGKSKLVHREVLFRTEGNPPSDKSVGAHDPKLCNNPSCINKRHLRWTSQAENLLDRDLAGTRKQIGETHTGTLLSEQDVIAIRTDKRRPCEIQKNYPVSYQTILDIKNRKSWKHV